MPSHCLFITILLVTACAGTTHAPRSTEREVPVRREASDALADRQAGAASGSLQATSLVGAPDTQLIERMVHQRLAQATGSAIRDLFSAAARHADARSYRDLLMSLQSLVIGISDGETRSQALMSTLLRVGLAGEIEAMFDDGLLPDLGCTAGGRLDAIYEGLAHTRTFARLGFPAATGTTLASCAKLSARISLVVDTVATVGLDASTLGHLPGAARSAYSACRDAGAWPVMPVDLRVPLSRLADGGPSAAFSAYADFRVAFVRARTALTSTNPPSEGDYERCFAKLQDLANIVASVQGTGLDLGDLPLGDVLENVRTARGTVLTQHVETAIAAAKAKLKLAGDALSALRELLLTGLTANDLVELARSAKSVASCVKTPDQAPDTPTKIEAFLSQCQDEDCTSRCEGIGRLRSAAHDRLAPALAQLDAKLAAALGSVPVETLAADASAIGEAMPELERWRVIERVIAAGARGTALTRGDIMAVTAELRRQTGAMPGMAAHITDAVLEVLPDAIREDSSAKIGMRLDVASLASTITTSYAEKRRAGLYLRATIGTGYLIARGEKQPIPSVHEELGVGYRWGTPSLLFGPHLFASGLLYQVVGNSATDGAFLFGAGLSLNLYHLIDVSAGAGALYRDGSGHPAAVISLQIPLGDYITALATSSSTTQSEGH